MGLVNLSCDNRAPQTEELIDNRNRCLPVLEPGKSEVRGQHGQDGVQAIFQAVDG